MALIKKYKLVTDEIDKESLIKEIEDIFDVESCFIDDENNLVIKSKEILKDDLVYGSINKCSSSKIEDPNIIEEIFYFKDIDCPNCAAKVEAALNKSNKIISANVVFLSKKIIVKHDKKFDIFYDVLNITRSVEHEADIAKTPFKDDGLPHEHHHHEHGECCHHDHGNHEGCCCHSEETCDTNEETCDCNINNNVRAKTGKCSVCGMDLEHCTCGRNAANKENKKPKIDAQTSKFIKYVFSALAVALAIMASAIQLIETIGLADFDSSVRWLKLSLFIIAYLILARNLIINSFKGFKRLDFFNENTLMLVASVGALCIEEGFEAIMVVLLNAIGEYFEDKATDNSKLAINDLIGSEIDEVTLKDGTLIKVEELKVNDLIIVKTGEKVPVDSVLVSNDAVLDLKSLTGESLPVYVEKGKEILSGSINTGKVIELEVSKIYNESTISKVKNLIEEANEKKSKTQRFITKFARYYTPIVMLIAVVTGLVLGFATNTPTNEVLNSVFSILVVACPCALVISIPLSYFSAIGRSAKDGLLVKGGNYLEALVNSKHFVFDKTGTLTKGNFKVSKVNPNKISEEELIEKAAMCESFSSHPIAEAIIEKYGKKFSFAANFELEEVAGEGLVLKYNDNIIYTGNEKLMKRFNIDFIKSSDVGSILYVSENKYFLGSIVVSDELKEESKFLIKWLKENGKITHMLSGDNEKIVSSIANELELDEYKSNLLPNDKYEELKAIIINNKGNTVYVGDGINDSPSLALSDVGISFGNLGSDVAKESSDVIIMNDDVSKIVDLMEISMQTKKIIIENIVFILLVKVIAIIIGISGVIDSYSMILSIFADVGVCMLAILNTRRILTYKIKKSTKKK